MNDKESKYYNPKRFKPKPNDIIYTPKKVAELMIKMCDICEGDKVLDCSKGAGIFFNNFPNNCEKDYCEITEGRDFFKYEKSVGTICGNPPYSLWNLWIKKTVELNPKKFCYIFGVYNLTPPRLKVIFDAGYIITKFHICKVDWWFSPSFIVLFEKGEIENSIITFDATAYFCDICDKTGRKCMRGRTETKKGVKKKWGMNECSNKK